MNYIYTRKTFINNSQGYTQKTENKICDLDVKQRETFVTFCKKCGKDVPIENIKYVVFRNQQTSSLCFTCQQKTKWSDDMTSKQKRLLIMLIEKNFQSEEQRNFYYKTIVSLTKKQASQLIQRLGYKSKQKMNCHIVSCVE